MDFSSQIEAQKEAIFQGVFQGLISGLIQGAIIMAPYIIGFCVLCIIIHFIKKFFRRKK